MQMLFKCLNVDIFSASKSTYAKLLNFKMKVDFIFNINHAVGYFELLFVKKNLSRKNTIVNP